MSEANQAAGNAANPVVPQAVAGPEETAQVEQQDAGFERASWSEFGFEERPEHVPVGAGEGGVGFAEVGKSLSVSPYCLDVDQWCARRGSELCGEFGEMIPAEAEAVQTAMGDFFTAAFEPSPVLRPATGCVDQARHQFLASLLETPEYHALHARTNFDSEASELACGSFAQAYGVIVAELTKSAPDGQTPEQQAKNEFRKQMKIMSAVSQGINQACQQVSNYEDACNAFGSCKGPGGQMDTKAMAGLFKKIRDNDALARICQLAGRYRRKAQSMQRRKVVHGRDDMVGTTLSGDIARVVPSELVAFNDPDLEVVALAKLAEKGLLSREYRGIEKVAAGPLMIFLDESGSMHGEPSYHAKSFALAMAWIAQHQNRWCCLVAFSGSSAIDDLRIMVLEPNRWKQEDLFAWLEQFEGGGTTIDWLHGNIMSQVFAKTGAEQGKTDVVVVSDAEVRTGDAVIGSCLEWKKANQAKVISIVLGTNNAGDLGRVSDKVFLANHLDVESDAVAEAFSI